MFVLFVCCCVFGGCSKVLCFMRPFLYSLWDCSNLNNLPTNLLQVAVCGLFIWQLASCMITVRGPPKVSENASSFSQSLPPLPSVPLSPSSPYMPPFKCLRFQQALSGLGPSWGSPHPSPYLPTLLFLVTFISLSLNSFPSLYSFLLFLMTLFGLVWCFDTSCQSH